MVRTIIHTSFLEGFPEIPTRGIFRFRNINEALRLGQVQGVDEVLLLGDLLVLLLHLELAELVVDGAVELGKALGQDIVGGAGVLSHVVTDLVDGTLGGAAAIGNLLTDAVDGALKPEAGLHDVLVDAVGLVQGSIGGIADALGDTVELVHHGLVVEPTLKVGTGGSPAATTVAATTDAVVTEAITPTAEEGEEDDENPPAVAVAPTVTVVAVAAGDSGDIGKARTHRVEHDDLLF